MPGGDRTGPLGGGPMTGRAGGYCAGYSVPGFSGRIPGQGLRGMGNRGGGRGNRNWFYATGLTRWQRAAQGVPGFAVTGGYGVPYGVHSVPNQSGGHQIEMLRNQANSLKSAIDDINARIAELESEAKEQ